MDTWSDMLFFSQVNWTQFLDPYNNGGLEVEPESSILYSTAVVFSRVRNITFRVFAQVLRCLYLFCIVCLMFLSLRLSCWSMKTSTTRPTRLQTSSHLTICRTSPGLVSTCLVRSLCCVEPWEPSPTARSALRSVACERLHTCFVDGIC